jgi:predicted nucleotidyltransferase
MLIDICGSNYSISNDYVDAVVLFGSKARGDDDYISDIDVLVIIDDCSESKLILLKKELVKDLNMPINWISVYRRSSIEDMRKYGSYFLWHIKSEGKILYSKTNYLKSVLDRLPPYSRCEEDLRDYYVICQDIEESIDADDSTVFYEMATLASLARNTCIAIAYKNGTMAFGRSVPVIFAQQVFGKNFPFSLEEYNVLYKYRLERIRNNHNYECSNMAPSVSEVRSWVFRIKKLINLALDICTEERG